MLLTITQLYTVSAWVSVCCCLGHYIHENIDWPYKWTLCVLSKDIAKFHFQPHIKIYFAYKLALLWRIWSEFCMICLISVAAFISQNFVMCSFNRGIPVVGILRISIFKINRSKAILNQFCHFRLWHIESESAMKSS